MRFKLTIVIFIFTLLFTACLTLRKITVDNFHIYETPPNGIKISADFFCDETEVDNTGWMEYVFWNKKIFGSQSMEYLSTFPDTLVWLKTDTCLFSYIGFYYGHPAYRNYPVVGISQKQAEEYSKWRSDRVFEYLLCKYKVIQFDTAQTRENHFTIERYFNGELKNLIPDKKVMYYPEYRLPSLNERLLILKYSDSIDNAYFNKCNSKYCLDCKKNFPKIWSDIVPCENGEFKTDPTKNIINSFSSKKGKPIYNIRGNVSEWTSEKNIAVGGGWKDKRKRILISDTINLTEPNAWTGFRNVCRWKRWKE
jgi:hypothetical protein